jgi:hypothetical protein
MGAGSMTRSPGQSAGGSQADKPRARGGRKRWLAVLVVSLCVVFFAPNLVALTPLRNLPLQMVLSGIEGTIRSGGASLGWFSTVEYRDVEIRDREGTLVAHVPVITADRTALEFLIDRSNAGTVILQEPEVHLITRADTSNAEDVLLPWLNKPKSASTQVQLEVNGGTVEIEDQTTGGKWALGGLTAKVQTIGEEDSPPSWSAEGKMSGAESGGIFAVASTADTKHAIVLKCERVPLAMFRWLAARGFSDIRISGQLAADMVVQPAVIAAARSGDATAEALAGQAVRGQIALTNLMIAGGPIGADVARVADLTIQSDLELADQQARVKQLTVDCEVGRVVMRGELDLALDAAQSTLDALARDPYTIKGQVDLARLARMLPKTLRIRDETQIRGGTVQWQLVSEPTKEGHNWNARFETDGLEAVNAGKAIRWERPVLVNLAARRTPAGLVIDSLEGSSDFMQLSGKGTADELTAEARFDLDRLQAQLGQLIDLDAVRFAGEAYGRLAWKRDAQGAFRATAAAQLKQFQLGVGGASVWSEENLTAELQATGRSAGTNVEELETAVLRAATGDGQAGGDQLDVHLRERIVKPANLERVPVIVHVGGDLGRWRARLSPWLDLTGWELSGKTDAHANVTWTPENCDVHSLKGSVQNLHVWTGDWFIDEPIAQFEVSGRFDAGARRLDLGPASIESSTASVRTDKVSIAMPAGGAPAVLGQVAFVADLEKLQRWTHDPRQPAALVWAGQLGGRANLDADGSTTSARFEATIDNFAAVGAEVSRGVSSGGPLRGAANSAGSGGVLWREKQLAIAMSGSYSSATDQMRLDNVQIGSEALKLQAAGQIDRLNDKAEINLQGTADYDWRVLSQLLTPYVGDSIRAEGRDSRRFAVLGPVGLDGDGARPPIVAVSHQPADPLRWIKPLSAQASIGWDQASVFGMHIGKGEFDFDLRDGKLKIDPVELAVSEGRVRLSPQAQLTPPPAELTHDRGKLIERVRVTPEMTATWLKYIAPAVAEATQTEGNLSLDLEGAKVPLFQPAAADASGRLAVHSLRVTPGQPLRDLILLAEQLRALIERRVPPTELDRNPTLLEMGDQAIDFRMVDGRVHHEGLTMNVGRVTIRTRGWVALDETIGLVAEVPIKAEWIERAPWLSSMRDKSLQIPIGGSLRRWELDKKAMKEIAMLFGQSAARDAVNDQLNKQLDRLFKPREQQ